MNKLRVLIVDDMARVRQGLRTLLPLAGEQAGLQIEVAGEAADGQAAVEQALALRPDAILMDLEMPKMDGCSAARAIHDRLPAIKILALTVHSDPISRQNAKEAGLNGFIEKGTPASELVGALISSFGFSKGECK